MAHKPSLGVGAVIALCYVPLVLLNLQLGIVLAVVLTFVQGESLVSFAPNAAAILVALAWIGTMRDRSAWAGEIVRRHGKLLAVLALFFAWLLLSALWARDPAHVWQGFYQWPAAMLTFIILITSGFNRRYVLMLAWAFLAGVTLSVLIGLLSKGLSPASSAIASAAVDQNRLSGSAGDPNYLAAMIVPALAVAAGLMGTTRSSMIRWGLATTMAVLVAGLGATESRGGFLAATVAMLVALLVFKRGRRQVILVLAVVASMTAVYLSAYPSTLHRLTSLDGGGNGRSDLWHIAWRVTEANPVLGVGLNNYIVVSADYVHEPGLLTAVALITDRPHVVHNTYLQMIAETGVVGLTLFVIFLIGCMRAALAAARRLDELRELALAGLARAIFVAMAGTLTASIFITNGWDRRLWILLAMGPLMLAVASRPSSASGA